MVRKTKVIEVQRGHAGEAELPEGASGQQIERGRACVQWCFEEVAGTPGSAMQVFSGKGKDQKSLLRAGSAPIGLSATRIYATETRRASYDRVPISSGMSGARVKIAIACLSPELQTWVNYCYNNSTDTKRKNSGRFTRFLMAEYGRRYWHHGMHSDTRSRVSLMLKLQALQGRHFWTFCQWDRKQPQELREIITQDMWKQTYSQHWKQIHSLMREIDDMAMMGICSGVGITEGA